MTIKELYEWALKHQCVDYDIKVYDDCDWRWLMSTADIIIDTKSQEVGL